VIGGAPDAAVWQLGRCLAPNAFFTVTEQVYARQSEWLAQATPQEQQRIAALPQNQQLAAWGRALGMDTFFARRGMPEARFNSCLGDQAQTQRLVQISQNAVDQLNLTGTPSFLVNGEKIEATDWSGVEQRLRSALGQ